jgi:hypothetical protein
MKNFASIIAFGVVCLSTVGASAQTRIERRTEFSDPKVYSGAECVEMWTHKTDTNHYWGGIYNTSGEEVEIFCPIKRQVTEPEVDVTVNVRAYDRNPDEGENPSCNLVLGWPSGGFDSARGSEQATIAYSNDVRMTSRATNDNVGWTTRSDYEWRFASYGIRCFLPDDTGIYNYHVSERWTVDAF